MDIAPLPQSIIVVGLDVGVKYFVVSSDGVVVDNPKHLYKYQHQLSKAQRSVSRKKKGSITGRKR